MTALSARTRFVNVALAQLGKPVCWAHKGPDVFDCSGLVTWCLDQVGGPKLEQVDNAQHLFAETRPLVAGYPEMPGDLIYFGAADNQIIHVGIVLAGGHVLDAAGATPRLPTLELAKASGASVRTHSTYQYRPNFRGVHRNHFLDQLDGVSR